MADDELVTTDEETFALFRAWLNTRRAERPDTESRAALTERLDQTGQTGGWLDPRPVAVGPVHRGRRMTDTYKAGQRLEAKYNGHVVTITHVDPDGGIRVTDTQGRTGISTVEYLNRLYRPIRGE